MLPLETILATQQVAIIRLNDLSTAIQLVRALLEGGIRAVELTLTNPDAPQVVRQLLSAIPEFESGAATLGMGSIRTLEEADMAIDSGAQFLVAPIFCPRVVERCKARKVAIFPGALTPTEIYTAWQAGADAVKVFPIKSLGAGYIRDVLAPMPFLKLMPTGGVRLDNIAAYLESGAVALGVGGSLVDTQRIANGDWGAIVYEARQFAQAASAAGRS